MNDAQRYIADFDSATALTRAPAASVAMTCSSAALDAVTGGADFFGGWSLACAAYPDRIMNGADNASVRSAYLRIFLIISPPLITNELSTQRRSLRRLFDGHRQYRVPCTQSALRITRKGCN